jgi:2-polyprenyl-3-methyl-5-hydroxy-6-metoxy-1,4-benzoquinol methylase/methyltransferase-like protein
MASATEYPLEQQELLDHIAQSYGQLNYLSFTYKQTHPNYLAALGHWHGLKPTNPFRCRILEIGCAGGGNLLPYAESHLDCQCVGIDLTKEHIDRAQEIAKRTGLYNVKFHHASITDFPDDALKFDYIICHGVFSWIPDFVQEAILSYIKRNLNENGLAYISYNTQPGWANLSKMRDMMRFFSRKIDKTADKVTETMSLLDQLIAVGKDSKNQHHQQLAHDAQSIKKHNHHYIAHEYFEICHQPLYIHEFGDMLEQHELHYLCDADVSSDSMERLPHDQRQWLQEQGLSDIEMAQYIDFFTNQRFRRSVICHRPQADTPLAKSSEYLKHLYLKMNVSLSEGQARPFYPLNNEQVSFNANKVRFSTNHPLLTAFYLTLVDAQSKPLIGQEIILRTLKMPGLENISAQQKEKFEQALCNEMQQGILRGIIALDSQCQLNSDKIPDFPNVGRLAHAQLQDQSWCIYPNGTVQHIKGFYRLLLPLLNGHNQLDEIVDKLTNSQNKQKLVIADQNGKKITDPKIISDYLQKQAYEALEKMHHDGVFEMAVPNPLLDFTQREVLANYAQHQKNIVKKAKSKAKAKAKSKSKSKSKAKAKSKAKSKAK